MARRISRHLTRGAMVAWADALGVDGYLSLYSDTAHVMLTLPRQEAIEALKALLAVMEAPEVPLDPGPYSGT